MKKWMEFIEFRHENIMKHIHHLIFDEVHRDDACDIQKSPTARMLRTVHPWSIGGIT